MERHGMCSAVLEIPGLALLRTPAASNRFLNRQTRAFMSRVARTYPRRTILMVGLLVLAGLFEGIGVAALLPVISAGVEQPAVSPDQAQTGLDAVSTAVRSLLEFLRIPRTLPVLLATVVVAIFLKGAFRWLAMRQVGFSVARVGRDLRERLVLALQNVRWNYFTSQPSGYFPNAISTETRRAATAYRNACSALAGLMQIPIYAGLIVAISWKVAIASLVLGSLGATVLGSFVGMGRKAGDRQTVRMKSLLAQLTDALQSIKPIKAMGREDKFHDLVTDDIVALEEAERSQVIASESLRSFQEPVLITIIAVGMLAAVEIGGVSFAEILVMAFLFHRLAGRIHFVQLEYEALAVTESAFWSLDELIAHAEAMAEPACGTLAAPNLLRGIEFESVSFGYDSRPVLTDISFHVPAGSFVAIIGPSGVGKTTILDLIAGLQEPESGRLLIDDHPLKDLDRLEWRRQIGYVPQETVLFHDTVLRNVWLAKETADPERVREVLAQADAWSFVESLPEGLDTILGERGSKLSGGQRQRIAIARALIGNPRLLMLDEATTALDPATEAAILRTLSKLRGKVTILAISHHAALRGVADLVYELDAKQITRIEGPDLPRHSVGSART